MAPPEDKRHGDREPLLGGLSTSYGGQCNGLGDLDEISAERHREDEAIPPGTVNIPQDEVVSSLVKICQDCR